MNHMEIIEKELLARVSGRVEPVGLRYDRLAREGLVYERAENRSEAAGWYFRCNTALVSRLLARCRRLLVCSEEDWLRQTLNSLEGEVLDNVETHAELPIGSGSFDGVVADSSILLKGDLAATLGEFKRILTTGGRLVILVANWEYEMAGDSLSYETSFRRYGGDVYLGFVRRSLSPPVEVEYVCLLDSSAELARGLARLDREELRSLSLEDVPEARKHVVSVDLIEIPQVTAASLYLACKAAGFRDVVVGGAPGIIAFNLSKAFRSLQGDSHLSPFGPNSLRHSLLEEVCQGLALSFPYSDHRDAPHIVAVATA